MNRYYFATLLVFGVVVTGCSQRNPSTYKQAVVSGRKVIPYAREFDEYFNDVHHFISYYDGKYGEPVWNSQVGLYQRYVLCFWTPVTFDRTGEHVVSYGEPHFHLREIASIQRSSGGVLRLKSGDDNKVFGHDEWETVVKANCDFRVLGVKMIRDKPLKLFDEYWNARGVKSDKR